MVFTDNDTHPLMPGIRCPGLNAEDWPRTLHDGQITGFSPLVCNMTDAPRVLDEIDVGGDYDWIELIVVAGVQRLLVCDGRIRLFTLQGEMVWECAESGTFNFVGDLFGDGSDAVVLVDGPRIVVLDATSGNEIWQRAFDPPHTEVRLAVGNVLSDRPGLEAVVFLAYGEYGCLIHFGSGAQPEVVWERRVVVPDEWQERFDHGCDIRLDFSDPDLPMIWNVRHHRCRGFDARTGEILSSLVYTIEDQQLRNYGPWHFAHDARSAPLICVVSENVQKHVHAIRLNRNGDSELAWSHYYGELYHVPGVAVEHVTTADIDGDGETELVYNVRDPEHDYRSFVRVRGTGTGTIKGELPDAWCAAAGPDQTILVFDAPGGATPDSGDLTIYRMYQSGQLTGLATLKDACVRSPGDHSEHLVIEEAIRSDDPGLVSITLKGATVEKRRIPDNPVSEASRYLHLETDIGTILLAQDVEGDLRVYDGDGPHLWTIPLSGGLTPTISAADLDNDGRQELVAATAGHRVRTFASGDDGKFVQATNYEFRGNHVRHGPQLFDLVGDGNLCLIAPGKDRDGYLCVRAWCGGETMFWETSLAVSSAQEGQAISWIADNFLEGGRAGVAISVNNKLRNIEGTFLLDGASGDIVWHREEYWQNGKVRPFLPHGLPTVYDIDDDGCHELIIDMLSYMAVLDGAAGSFAYLKHTRNMGPEGALSTGDLYNSYVPVFPSDTDVRPHWFVPLGGFGSFGLMCPDPVEGVWQEDPGYDIPWKAGLIDVDGDGSLEVGYVLKNHDEFHCRDLWTGREKWRLSLPEIPDGPVIVADVDGDGKGEFLVGRYCIGTDVRGVGELRWESPVPLGWALIADLDGDGVGEIACPLPGKIVVLKGSASRKS